MGKAIGLLEVQGFSVALAAMDQACKVADITIHGMDCNNPATGDLAPIPVIIQVKFSGKISDVQIALDVAREEALKHTGEDDIVTRFIPSAADGLYPLLSSGKVEIKE